MGEDHEALQGVWKLEAIRSQGKAVHSSVTHWEFDGDRLKEIIPFYVEGGTWATFTLDTTTTPKHLDTTYTTTDNKTGEVTTRTYKHAYELNGDTLRVGGVVVYNHYPEQIDEAISKVTTLRRYEGPRPETKKASGRLPVESPVLGILTWSDDHNKWEANVAMGAAQEVRVTLEPAEPAPNHTIAVGEALVAWAKESEPDVRAYAAREMIDLAEDWRDEDEDPEPLTPESFADRITLEAVSIGGDGSATFWYDDDNIFAGHIIVVSVNSDREFTDVQIMG